MSTSLEAGIDARTAWAREAQRATGFLKSHLLDISDAVNQGHSLTDALAPTRDYFPPIFREMAAVGEQTGHLDAVFAQLADHYQTQLNMRRTFLVAITWPMIAVDRVAGGRRLSHLGHRHDLGVDILRLGLKGAGGLKVYLLFLFIVGRLAMACSAGRPPRAGLDAAHPAARAEDSGRGIAAANPGAFAAGLDDAPDDEHVDGRSPRRWH